MSITLLGCVLVIFSAAASALLIFRLRSDVTRPDLLSRLRLSSRRFGQARMWLVPAGVFLLVASVGAAVSTMRDAPEATGSRDAMSSLPRSKADSAKLARLTDFAGPVELQASAPRAVVA